MYSSIGGISTELQPLFIKIQLRKMKQLSVLSRRKTGLSATSSGFLKQSVYLPVALSAMACTRGSVSLLAPTKKLRSLTIELTRWSRVTLSYDANGNMLSDGSNRPEPSH